jgi:hypothetical protein
MQTIQMLVVVGSIVAASIASLNVAQVVHATGNTGAPGTCPCGSGNPHVPDPDTGIVPQGNPHDIESGFTNGNPHIKG